MLIRGKILIVEGPDGVGKTTLINYIKEKHKNSFYMHLRVHKNMKLWHTASVRLAIKKQMQNKLVLIDRHWPSEQCYSYIRSSGPSYNPKKFKENHRINREQRHEEYHDIDNVIDDYYFSWFGKCKRNNFLRTLSPLRDRNDFIRYDMFKDGHKLDQFTNRIFNERH